MSSAQIHANELQKKIEPVRQPGRELIRRQEQGPVQDVAPQVAYRRIQFNRDGLRPADLLALQRVVGNRALQRMLAKANDEQQDEAAEEDSERAVQTKRTVGAPEDVYEQGADRVADQVMTMPDAAAERPNRTGLPDGLKSGIESLSGIALDTVNVHYNSSQPAQLNALAYAQGSDIHVASGQEQHLPHEAWHVVQQAQGRVQPTMQMTDGVPVNDDAGLEQEADVMGARASQMRPHEATMSGTVDETELAAQRAAQTGEASQVKREARGPAKEEGRLNFLSSTFSVIQADKKTVNGVEVDTGGGYTTWEGWHINWKLGSKKGGFEQYHLTSQDRTQHYFFIINGNVLEDTKPPAKLVPSKGTHGGLSKAPPAVQLFVRTYINDLLP